MHNVIVLAIPDLHHQCRTMYLNGVIGHWSTDQTISDILEEYLDDGYIIRGQSSFSENGIVWTLIKDR